MRQPVGWNIGLWSDTWRAPAFRPRAIHPGTAHRWTRVQLMGRFSSRAASVGGELTVSGMAMERAQASARTDLPVHAPVSTPWPGRPERALLLFRDRVPMQRKDPDERCW